MGSQNFFRKNADRPLTHSSLAYLSGGSNVGALEMNRAKIDEHDRGSVRGKPYCPARKKPSMCLKLPKKKQNIFSIFFKKKNLESANDDYSRLDRFSLKRVIVAFIGADEARSRLKLANSSPAQLHLIYRRDVNV